MSECTIKQLSILYFNEEIYHTFSFSEMSYALVAGYDDDHQKSCPQMEVMYVNGTTKICKSTANYPEDVYYLNGDSFFKNSLIVACGGADPLTSACYSMVTVVCKIQV